MVDFMMSIWHSLNVVQRGVTQPETPQTCCKLWINGLDVSCQQVRENQTCCNLIFADLLQVVEKTCIKLVDKKS